MTKVFPRQRTHGSGKRRWFEVRVREKIGPNEWVKKSRYYKGTSSSSAAACYGGPGDIICVSKVSEEKALGVGEFFRLGDDLLKELKRPKSGGG